MSTATLSTPAPVLAGTEPEVIDLWGWADSIDPKAPGHTAEQAQRAAEAQDAVIAVLFGHLVDRTDGTVEHYRSDLYRDAQRLQKSLTGPCRFWFVARSWGTNIMWEDEPGSPACLADLMWGRSHDEQSRGWWVEVKVTERRWSAVFTPITSKKA